jgi:hypothetical protein
MIKPLCIAIIALTVTFLGGLQASDATAQTLTVDQFQHPKGERDLNSNKPYLEGIRDGLIAYNMSLENKLFCLGETPSFLTFERTSDTLLSWARRRRGDAASLPLGLALLYSFKEAFPCNNPRR